MDWVPGFEDAYHFNYFDGARWVENANFMQLAPPLAVIKVHGPGLEWWDTLDMPETWTIKCTACIKYSGEGQHLIYELADGFDLPLGSMFDIELDTVTRFFTRVPPDPTKEWVHRVRPVLLDHFPTIPERWAGSHEPWYADYQQYLAQTTPR